MKNDKNIIDVQKPVKIGCLSIFAILAIFIIYSGINTTPEEKAEFERKQKAQAVEDAKVAKEMQEKRAKEKAEKEAEKKRFEKISYSAEGKQAVIKEVTYATPSLSDFDELMTYIKAKNKGAIDRMQARGDAIILTQGNLVTVVKVESDYAQVEVESVGMKVFVMREFVKER